MFWMKREKMGKFIKETVESIIDERELRKAPIPAPPETVDCEVCGCMIKKEKAVIGKSEIKGEGISLKTMYWDPIKCSVEFHNKEYIHTPWYCRRCAPKKKRTKD